MQHVPAGQGFRGSFSEGVPAGACRAARTVSCIAGECNTSVRSLVPDGGVHSDQPHLASFDTCGAEGERSWGFVMEARREAGADFLAWSGERSSASCRHQQEREHKSLKPRTSVPPAWVAPTCGTGVPMRWASARVYFFSFSASFQISEPCGGRAEKDVGEGRATPWERGEILVFHWQCR